MSIEEEGEKEGEREGKRGDLSFCEFVLDVDQVEVETDPLTAGVLKGMEVFFFFIFLFFSFFSLFISDLFFLSLPP